MSVRTPNLVETPGIAVTGGTALNFVEDGQTIPNGLHLVCASDPAYNTRRQLTFKVRQPSLDPKSGTFSKGKRSVSVAVPIVLGTGTIVFNTVRIECEIHPDYVDDAAQLYDVAAQLLVETRFRDFWNIGSLT